MTSGDCVFCAIVAGKIPAQIVADYGDILVIRDIAPKAPTHCLIMPKKHYHDLTACTEDDASLLGQLLLSAKKLSQSLPGIQSFRLVVNTGKDSGQSVFHVHAHFLSGKKMVDL